MGEQLKFPKEYLGETEEEIKDRLEREKKSQEIKDLKLRILRVNDDYRLEDFKLLMGELKNYEKRIKEIFHLRALAETREERNKFSNMLTNPGYNELDEYKEIAEIYQKYERAKTEQYTRDNKNRHQKKLKHEGMWYLKTNKGG